MDGLPLYLPLQAAPLTGSFRGSAQQAAFPEGILDFGFQAQRTLKTSISCVGVGLHSGKRVELGLHPAASGTGILFRRTDLGVDIPARFDHVLDTRLCTVIGLSDRPGARVSTVEHVMAALAGAGITNAVVTVDGPEVPILDGSSASFLFLIDCAGIVAQDAPAPAIEILRPVRVTDREAYAELRPATGGLELAMSIDFEAEAIGRQAFSMRLSPASFRGELARARTFTLASEVAALQAAGLALGGNLDNAVVVDGAKVLNPSGLRMRDEFVRHKLLDAVGDLALAGTALHGRYVSHRGGHALNNRLVRAVFADDANWGLLPAGAMRDARLARANQGSATLPPLASWQERRLPVAAAPV